MPGHRAILKYCASVKPQAVPGHRARPRDFELYFQVVRVYFCMKKFDYICPLINFLLPEQKIIRSLCFDFFFSAIEVVTCVSRVVSVSVSDMDSYWIYSNWIYLT